MAMQLLRSATYRRIPRYEDVILSEPGLVSYWRMGELQGTVLNDSKGTNHGTYEPGYTQGVQGAVVGRDTAVRFDGISGRAVVPHSAGIGSLHLSTFALEAWVWLPDYVNFHMLLTKSNGFGIAAPFELYVAGGSGQAVFAIGDGTTSFAYISPSGLPTQRWNHVFGFMASDDAEGGLVVNGNLVFNEVISAMADGLGPVMIGGRPDDIHYSNAVIDEVAIYGGIPFEETTYVELIKMAKDHYYAGLRGLA